MQYQLQIAMLFAAMFITPRVLTETLDYTINFPVLYQAGIEAPPTGSFEYDPSSGTFSDFLINWGGGTYNLTDSANNPTPADAYTLIYCGTLQNGYLTFAWIAGACAKDANIEDAFLFSVGDGFGSASLFVLYGVESDAGLVLQGSAPVQGNTTGYAYGLYTVSESQVPEPSSLILLATALCIAIVMCLATSQHKTVRLPDPGSQKQGRGTSLNPINST